MAKTGKVAVLDKIEGIFAVKEYPLPTPGTGQMLIKQDRCGICGTDIHMYHGKLPGIVYPIVLGHEFCGTIAALGENVTEDYLGRSLKVGDRVSVLPTAKDYSEYFSVVAHSPTTLQKTFSYGFSNDADKVTHFDGGYGEYVFLKDPRSKVLKSNLDPETLCLLEPFTVGAHAAERARIRLGDTVVVQGTGAVGLFTQLCAKLSGAAKIINVGGPTQYRVELAKKFGADIIININEVKDRNERIKIIKEESVKGLGADVVFDCTGVPSAVPEGLDMLRISGTFVEVGAFTDAGPVEINPFVHFCHKNVNIQGSWASDLKHWIQTLPILERKEFPYAELVTHTVGLHELNEAIQFPAKGYKLHGKEVGKVLVDGSKY
jgi:L-iditol 2-dehydrogenase